MAQGVCMSEALANALLMHVRDHGVLLWETVREGWNAVELQETVECLVAQGVPLALDARGISLRHAPVPWLDAEEILGRCGLETRNNLDFIKVFAVLDSTNTYLKANPPNEGMGVVLAEHQSAGRGRLGRSWLGAFGGGLALSLAFVMHHPLVWYQALPLACGMMAVEALGGLGVPGLALKWPNDVVVRQKKLAGLLLESVALPSGNDGQSRRAMVVGIGLNVAMPLDWVGPADRAWTDLAALCGAACPGRLAVAAALLDALVAGVLSFERSGFLSYHQRWSSHDALAGEAVSISIKGSHTEGRACGITETGALRIMTADGCLHEAVCGEASVRMVQACS
jgi:BirA family biotin operon repressor/biotin-[acetyl-CoA-carboxylase] ligase